MVPRRQTFRKNTMITVIITNQHQSRPLLRRQSQEQKRRTRAIQWPAEAEEGCWSTSSKRARQHRPLANRVPSAPDEGDVHLLPQQRNVAGAQKCNFFITAFVAAKSSTTNEDRKSTLFWPIWEKKICHVNTFFVKIWGTFGWRSKFKLNLTLSLTPSPPPKFKPPSVGAFSAERSAEPTQNIYTSKKASLW